MMLDEIKKAAINVWDDNKDEFIKSIKDSVRKGCEGILNELLGDVDQKKDKQKKWQRKIKQLQKATIEPSPEKTIVAIKNREAILLDVSRLGKEGISLIFDQLDEEGWSVEFFDE